MYSLARQGQSNNYFNLIQLSYDLTYSDVTYFNTRTDKKNIDFLNKITRIRLRLTLFRTPSPRRSEKYITDKSSDLKKRGKKEQNCRILGVSNCERTGNRKINTDFSTLFA